MKKYALAVLLTTLLSACATEAEQAENATILSRKDLTGEMVELVVQKDDGEMVVITRENDAGSAVGTRLNIDSDSSLNPSF